MEYADILVKSGTKTKVDKLERIKKKAKCCAGLGKHRGNDYNDLIEEYGVEPLWKHRKHHRLSVMYQNAQDTTNLNSTQTGITLRSSIKIKLRDGKTTLNKARHTRADNLNLSVHFATFSEKISVGLKCTDKLHSVRLLTICYLKIRYNF